MCCTLEAMLSCVHADKVWCTSNGCTIFVSWHRLAVPSTFVGDFTWLTSQCLKCEFQTFHCICINRQNCPRLKLTKQVICLFLLGLFCGAGHAHSEVLVCGIHLFEFMVILCSNRSEWLRWIHASIAIKNFLKNRLVFFTHLIILDTFPSWVRL